MFGMSNRKYILRNKKRFILFIFITLFITSTLIYTVSVSGFSERKYISVTVNAGDSLWSIAEKYSGDSDIRKFIYEIKKINHMKSGDLYADSTILVPEYKS
jgi:LysM repeat protein